MGAMARASALQERRWRAGMRKGRGGGLPSAGRRQIEGNGIFSTVKYTLYKMFGHKKVKRSRKKPPRSPREFRNSHVNLKKRRFAPLDFMKI